MNNVPPSTSSYESGFIVKAERGTYVWRKMLEYPDEAGWCRLIVQNETHLDETQRSSRDEGVAEEPVDLSSAGEIQRFRRTTHLCRNHQMLFVGAHTPAGHYDTVCQRERFTIVSDLT